VPRQHRRRRDHQAAGSIDETAAFVCDLLKKQSKKEAAAAWRIDFAKRAQIAERLKEARQLVGLSQGHVAKMLGLHRRSVSEVEAGNRRVSADELARLAEIYDVSVDWLLGEAPETLDARDVRLELAALELSKLSAMTWNVCSSSPSIRSRSASNSLRTAWPRPRRPWTVKASFRKNVLHTFQMLLQGSSHFGRLAAANCGHDPAVIVQDSCSLFPVIWKVLFEFSGRLADSEAPRDVLIGHPFDVLQYGDAWAESSRRRVGWPTKTLITRIGCNICAIVALLAPSAFDQEHRLQPRSRWTETTQLCSTERAVIVLQCTTSSRLPGSSKRL
jgi:transcriptional regulator with XRE-family HTH domain